MLLTDFYHKFELFYLIYMVYFLNMQTLRFSLIYKISRPPNIEISKHTTEIFC